MEQYLFYQHNVQQYFLRHEADFSGVAVPMSIAVSFLDGTNGFLRALFARDNAKRFFIDPRTALFQRRWNRENVRPPHERMAKHLGALFQAGLTRAVLSTDLTDELLQQATIACVEFQQRFSEHEPEQQRKLNKYAKLADVETLPVINNPQDFVPPYFMFEDRQDPFYTASLDCTRFAAERFGVENIRPIIHPHNVLTTATWQAISDDLQQIGVQRIALYPNDFKEHERSEDELRRLCSGVKVFSDAGIATLQLHGGYFAITLQKLGLAGFGNGVGYGEWRDSRYNKGGTAEKRIYMPRLHRFLDPIRAEALLREDPEFFAGDSEFLSEIVHTERSFADVTLEEALDHFMASRREEMAFVTRSTPAAIAEQLAQTATRLDNLGELEQQLAPSLRRWSEIITQWE